MDFYLYKNFVTYVRVPRKLPKSTMVPAGATLDSTALNSADFTQNHQLIIKV